MTINEFFLSYPINKRKFAKMLDQTEPWLNNRLYHHARFTPLEVALINEAIQEVSYQLSKVFVHDSSIFIAKCLGCKREFTAINEEERAVFYSEHGLYCDPCREGFHSGKFFLYEDNPELQKE